MACKSSFEFHHHFPKLAEEAGFVFNLHRSRNHVDWNKIRLIDIDNIIKDRRFILIEQHLPDLLHCVLESEFDVRILDEGVIKMFRLAQLTVEYQQFCRQYLDRSVYVLREEINSLAQELDTTKSSLREKEEELRRIKRKTKHTYRTPLPFGNDNIATMILKTLANKGDIFPSTSNTDALQLQYNKCSYCDKVFLNQLYLKSHLSRRHANSMEIPQKDVPDNFQNTSTEKENSKLNDEIMELKTKLKEMEKILIQVNNQNLSTISKLEAETNTETETAAVNKEVPKESTEVKKKDVEVATNIEYNVMDKIEEWKKEEHDKYNKEINLLRTQIVELINSFKNKEEEKLIQTDHNLIEKLHTTIQQQGLEINFLKKELSNTKLATENEEKERKREAESKLSLWAKRVEAQSKKYEALLQQLNDVALEAKEARAQAEAERVRSARLQVMLEESMKNKESDNMARPEQKNPSNSQMQSPKSNSENIKVKRKLEKTKPVADHKTLENLHRKAQELLNIESTSSSEMSSDSVEKIEIAPKIESNLKEEIDTLRRNKVSVANKRYKTNKASKKTLDNSKKRLKTNNDEEVSVCTKKERKKKKEKARTNSNVIPKVGNGTIISPGSPMKLVRAKITEEVNSRLVTLGVDPLKHSLPKSYFQKQKIKLQQEHEAKAKKNPDYQKFKHTILAYLDSNTPNKKVETDIQDYVSPNKISKAFSITSVISNVKNKALSLVKSNEINVKTRRKELSAEIAKKAMSLLKTPPDSAPTSPTKLKTPIKTAVNPQSPRLKVLQTNATTYREKPLVTKKQISTRLDYTDDDDTSESDHKYYNSAIVQQSAKSIENLIKSPARRPSSANNVDNNSVKKISNPDNILRSQSAGNILEYKVKENKLTVPNSPILDNSSEEIGSLEEAQIKKIGSEGNIPKQTKGVLKNASSTSSLNKKKVLFDMDAIQMKSVSASPSQSLTEKSEIIDDNEKFELGLINLDGEEWDISSIENEPLKNDTKIQVVSRTSPKIAELRETIESQLARRNVTPSTALAGGVDLMPAQMMRTSSLAGSNTSLGSSILDESEETPPKANNKAFVKPKKITDNKDDSEFDISEYSLDGIGVPNKKGNDSF